MKRLTIARTGKLCKSAARYTGIVIGGIALVGILEVSVLSTVFFVAEVIETLTEKPRNDFSSCTPATETIQNSINKPRGTNENKN